MWGPDAFDEKMFPNDEVPDFKGAIDDVRSALENAGKKILRCIEIYLDLEEGALTSKHRNLGDHSIKIQTQMRSLYYYTLNPNHSFPSNVIRCGEHSDWRTITFLMQDMIGGLEVKTSEGEWISAFPIENAIFLNSGQFSEYWSFENSRDSVFSIIQQLHRLRIITEGREARKPRFVYSQYTFDHYQRLIEAATSY